LEKDLGELAEGVGREERVLFADKVFIVPVRFFELKTYSFD
jgi:hypothetical protein